MVRDAADADKELAVMRSLYQRHASREWMSQHIDADFREQIGALYSALATANIPAAGVFAADSGMSTQCASVSAYEWNNDEGSDALSTWDMKVLPSVTIGDDKRPPSVALQEFINDPHLSDMLLRTKRDIINDVPKTFVEFEGKSHVIAKYLEATANRQSMESALCRILCVSCKLLRVGYALGMNYLACSVLLNCVCESDEDVMLEIKACQLYCHLLSCQDVCDWFRESKILRHELKKLEFVLSRHVPSALGTQYLLASGCPIVSWATDWFTTCCAVGAPREVTLFVQSMLYSGESPDIIIKVGVAMMSLLQDEILQLKGIKVWMFVFS